MPIYEYCCPHCGLFDALTPMSEASQPATCFDCGALSPRIISAPRLAVMGNAARRLHERNERGAHEPKHAHKHVCDGGCHHAKPSERRVDKRPWMLGH
jgi:putative FmdB family regulatory protein